MTAIPERDLRGPKSPTWSASQNISKTPSNVCGSKRDCSMQVASNTFEIVEVFFLPRARLSAANERASLLTRIVTDLYNMMSSAFRGFAPASNRSSSNLRGLATRVATGGDFSNPRSKHHRNVPRVSSDVGSHRVTRSRTKLPSQMFPSEWNFSVHFPSYFENKTLSNYFSS